jgi:hypothetical protein
MIPYGALDRWRLGPAVRLVHMVSRDDWLCVALWYTLLCRRATMVYDAVQRASWARPVYVGTCIERPLEALAAAGYHAARWIGGIQDPQDTQSVVVRDDLAL